MSEGKLLTVVIPVYNAEKYIEASLNSVLNSSFSNFDIIIIENGSTDSSKKILKRYERENKNIRLIYLKSNDLIKAMNIGIKNSNTKYIAIMDSDDICPNERFEKQISFLENNENIVLVGTSIYYFTGAKKKWKIKLPSDNDVILSGIRKYGQMIFNPTIMFRKECAQKANYYSAEDYPVPDLGFFLRMSNLGQLSNLSEIYQGVRLSEKSFTQENFNSIVKKQILIINNHFALGKSTRLFEKKLLLSKFFYKKVLLGFLSNKYIEFFFYSFLTIIIRPVYAVAYLTKKIISK